MHLRKRCILLYLHGLSWRYQWDPSHLMDHLRLVFLFWWSVHWYEGFFCSYFVFFFLWSLKKKEVNGICLCTSFTFLIFTPCLGFVSYCSSCHFKKKNQIDLYLFCKFQTYFSKNHEIKLVWNDNNTSKIIKPFRTRIPWNKLNCMQANRKIEM